VWKRYGKVLTPPDFLKLNFCRNGCDAGVGIGPPWLFANMAGSCTGTVKKDLIQISFEWNDFFRELDINDFFGEFHSLCEIELIVVRVERDSLIKSEAIFFV